MIRSLAFSLLLAHAASAQEPVAEAVKALNTGPPTAETLAEAVPLLADPAGRNAIRTAILTLDPFPSDELTGLLAHPELAVRLGALELLEEKSGGDFSFNPWTPPGATENEGSLARWKQWAGEDPKSDGRKDLFDEGQRRGYLRDLLGNDSDKSARARRMLEADGLGAVGFLETFLAESATLPAGSRAKVREAQYQIVLSRPLGPQAAATARQLAFGNRDQTLAALGTLRGAGLVALPILRDFLRHADPLVRETAIDAMLSAGGSQALPIIGPVLAAETDVNVIHGALRRLKDIPGDESLKIAASFLSHEDEDLLVSAIQACLKLAGGDQNSIFGSRSRSTASSEAREQVGEKVIAALSDPRWRVRTAALEFVTGRKLAAAKERCVELLSDPDEFVRFSAIKAAAALRAEGAAEKLKEMFLADAGMTGPVLEGYAALNRDPDAEMIEKLATYPPDARLAAIRAAEADSDLTPVVLRFAADPDLDVACAAIRFLSADADRVDTSEVSSVLLAALRSDSPEKRGAALDRLALPSTSGAVDPGLANLVSKYTAGSGEKTALDPLYDAFHKAAGEQAAAAPAPSVEVVPGAKGELFKVLADIAAGESDHAFRAGLCLAKAGHPGGLGVLTERLPKLSTAQRAAIAEQLYDPSRTEALELLRLLLRDPVEEIRSAAAGSALSNDNAPAFLTMVLDELAAPGAELQPHEIYSYQFESAARQGRRASTLRAWALSVIRDDDATDPLRVLALIGLRQQFPASATEPVLALAKSSPSRWVRRAAWQTMGTVGSAAFRQNLATLAADPVPQVRAVLANVSGRMDAAWKHRFDDTRAVTDNSWYSDRDSRRLTPDAKAALEDLAATDPSPEVRFESMFALLSQGQTIDVEAFATLLPRQPEEADASSRVARWMASNSRRIGPGLAPVAAALDASKVQTDTMQQVLASIAPPDDGGGGFASFAALVAGAEAIEAAPQQTEDETKDDAPESRGRETLKVVYFFKPGCAECDKASQLLDTVKADFPLMEIERHNFNETAGIEYHQVLASRFGVPSDKMIAPAIFTQTGFLVEKDILPQALGGLLASTMSAGQDDAWSVVAQLEIAAAQEVVKERFRSLTLPLVLTAGLIDGVNPCAFATIIFFLSYLQIARRTPREMLMVGAAFISAVFLAYFLAGLVLHQVLAQFTDRIAGIKPWLDWGFGGLALVAAFLSFRDAYKARSGKLDEMSLQLPGFLKDRIRGVIRSGARARRFVIAAFLSGIVISFLELACTGQVYAPIIYTIQQGQMDAVAWLLAYNVAFITPLIAIFGLAYTGMTSNRLVAFQTRHTFAVKIALGLVFVALAVIIVFGSRIFGGAP